MGPCKTYIGLTERDALIFPDKILQKKSFFGKF
jgi:hypothetical protein